MLFRSARRRRWEDVPNTAPGRKMRRDDVGDGPNAAAHGLPVSADKIVLKAVAPNPDDRYTTADEFRKALEMLLKELGEKMPAAEIGRFMSREFARERKGAAGVIRARLAQLDAEDARVIEEDQDLDSVTALRSAIDTSPAASALTPSLGAKEAAMPTEEHSPLPIPEEKLRTPEEPPKKTSLADATLPSRRKRSERSRAPLIAFAVIGFSAAAALGFLGLRGYAKTSVAAAAAPSPVPSAAPVAPIASPPAAAAAQAEPATTTAAAETASAAPAGSIDNRHPLGHHRKGHNAAPAAVAKTNLPDAPVAIAAPPQPAPPPSPVAPKPAASVAPSLDKNDPWSHPPNPNMTHDDPWK